MKNKEVAKARKAFILGFLFLGLIAAIVFLPYQFRSQAGNTPKTSANQQVEKSTYFDIRTDKKSIDILNAFRAAQGRSAVQIADQRDAFVRGEQALQQKVPTLKVEYNKELGNPEIIAPDALQGRAFLTAPSSAKRSDVLKNFIKENDALVGLSNQQIDDLKVAADYTNPNGELSFVRLEQLVGEIPVFRAEIRAGFNKQDAMFRVVSNLASNADYSAVSAEFGAPLAAVEKAAGYIDYQLKESDKQFNRKASSDLKAVYGEGDWATTAEKMYFPIEGGVLRPSWRVLNWQKGDAFYVIVDAETGTMLYRENITYSQTQAATYNVYANNNSMLKAMGNPSPIAAPGLLDPTLGTQPPLQPRSNVTAIGNEAPYAFNNLGWITDNTNGANGHTDGNNVQAGIDRDVTNGVDAVVPGTNRVFNFAYTPGAGPNNTGGDDPLTPAYQNGVSTNLFYVTNRYHDETYLLGFTEAARNFQNDNFGRGGAAADRISAEAQDNTAGGSACPVAPCFNNANFSTPADGGRGRMQMYLWNGPTPDRDGDLDAEIIVHELTHGLFGRLHNGTGGTQAGQMNEGNSDFFAHVLLSLDNDPINGVFVTGGYATLLLRGAGFTSNYYYGIRRFPKAVLSFTGGPNNRPHNPLTFADIDPAQMNLTNGAFAPAFTGSATAVHDGGEIWSSILWEVRAKLIARLGNVNGNKKVLQLAMDGMKVAPSNPTMIQERNAIIQAAGANGNSADLGDLWAGFAVRGLGFSATNPSGNTVTEGYDLPNLYQTPDVSVSDSTGDNDGFPEPGETITVNVPLTNSTGGTATNVTAQIVGGGSADYGTINNAQTVSRPISYIVPANTPCGSAITLTINVNSSLGATSFSRSIIIGVPVTTYTENFDGAVAPAFPAGWTAVSVQSGITFVNSTLNADTASNSAFALDPITVGGGTDLTSPSTAITSAAATVSFRNRYDTESGWDGGALEISINGGAYQDIITAGGRFITNGYNGSLGAGANNPLANRQAWSGNSGGYVTTTVQLPAAAAGQNVQFKWRFGADDNTAGQGPNPGWYVDTIRVNGNYACSFTPSSLKSRADFDGDGKTDVSVFRASEGNWYLNQSASGFGVIKWGLSTDTIVPGHYDADNKTDLAVFRPSDDPAVADYYILNSTGFTVSGVSWGVTSDTPVIGDYDNDGKTDIAVYRQSNNTFYILKSGGGSTVKQYGVAGDVAVSGDYVGDNATDVAIFRPSTNTYWILNGGGDTVVPFGSAGDVLVPADYDNDNKTDIAVFRPSTGQWIVRRSSDLATTFTSFGTAGDVPVPGDYDGDGADDFAIYRNGAWWILRSTAGTQTVNFGLAADKPVPSAYIP
ncbi:MAG TPA: M36 family metallopeptidase [Pyrinomonadaceae bacterium]|nr:M36 family metallopeptidase [Pyrinomonadaceae bacterium]